MKSFTGRWVYKEVYFSKILFVKYSKWEKKIKKFSSIGRVLMIFFTVMLKKSVLVMRFVTIWWTGDEFESIIFFKIETNKYVISFLNYVRFILDLRSVNPMRYDICSSWAFIDISFNLFFERKGALSTFCLFSNWI